MGFDKKFIDIRTANNLTVGNVVSVMQDLQRENPDMEIYLDGDTHCIVGRIRA